MTEKVLGGIRALFYLFAFALLVFGGAMTWNLFVGSRIGMSTFLPNGFKFFGPTIITIAILLLITIRKKSMHLQLDRLSGKFLVVGIALIVFPPIVGGFYDTIVGGEGAYNLLIGIICFSFPGIVIFIAGGIVGVRAMLREPVGIMIKDTDDRSIK